MLDVQGSKLRIHTPLGSLDLEIFPSNYTMSTCDKFLDEGLCTWGLVGTLIPYTPSQLKKMLYTLQLTSKKTIILQLFQEFCLLSMA